MLPFLSCLAVGVALWIAAVRPRLRVLVLATSLAAAAVIAWNCGLVPEDSFISFRYARNLAEGNGLVYNPGERVEGYTNFLWTLWMALVHVLDWPVLETAVVSSVACHLAAIAVVYRISTMPADDGRAPPLPIAPALLAVSAPAGLAAASGLETSLFEAMVTIAVAAQIFGLRRGDRRLVVLSAVPLALAALTRPEGAMIAVVSLFACVVATWRDPAFRKPIAMAAVAVGAVVAAHFVWRRLYYGDWLPNTYYCKVGYTGRQVWRGVNQTDLFLRLEGGVVYLPAVVAVLLWQRHRWLLPAVATALAMAVYVTLIGGDNFWRFRYLVPALPCAFLLIEEGVRLATQGAAADWRPAVRGATAFCAIALLWAATYDPAGARNVGRSQRVRLETSTRATGEWIRSHSPPGATMAVLAAGAIPYYARIPTIDMLGLNDRHIAHSAPQLPMGSRNAGHEKFDFAYVLSRKPTYILFQPDNRKFEGEDVVSTAFRQFPELLRRLREEYVFEEIHEGDVSFNRWRRSAP